MLACCFLGNFTFVELYYFFAFSTVIWQPEQFPFIGGNKWQSLSEFCLNFINPRPSRVRLIPRQNSAPVFSHVVDIFRYSYARYKCRGYRGEWKRAVSDDFCCMYSTMEVTNLVKSDCFQIFSQKSNEHPELRTETSRFHTKTKWNF